MSWHYSPVGSSLWQSRKFMALGDDPTRLSYIYLLTCRHGNGLGAFRLPTIYLAGDRGIEPKVAAAQVAKMVEVGLVETDAEDMVRLIGWFIQDTGANNPSTVTSFCKLFQDARIIKRSDLRSRALAEMLWATMTRAESWNPATAPFERMMKDVDRMLRQELKADKRRTVEAFQQMPPPDQSTLLRTLLDTLSHTVSDTLYHIEQALTPTPTPAIAPAPTPAVEEFRAGEPDAKSPPSPPADGGQAAHPAKIPNPEIQAQIDELRSKAKKATG